MRVAEIPTGARLFDTIHPYTPAILRALKDAGADGIFGYLGGNATPDAIANTHALGMGFCFVSYSRAEGWGPSAALGEADGTAAIARLRQLAVPFQTDGLRLCDWADLEGAASDPTGWGQARANASKAAGLLPSLYVGAECRLKGGQLYALPFERYARACSIVPEPGCGWCWIQLYPPNLTRGGIEVDVGVACQDWRGRSATWLVGG